MKRRGMIDRVIGYSIQKQKEAMLRELEDNISQKNKEKLFGEREKTPEEMRMIRIAQQAMREVFEELGYRQWELPEEQIHIISNEKWQEPAGKRAYTSLEKNGIVLREEGTRVVFIKTLIHELIHAASYNAVQKIKESDDLGGYRMGTVVIRRDGKEEYFRWMNEAITEELTRKIFLTRIASHIFFADEKKKTEMLREKYKKSYPPEYLGENIFFIDEIREGHVRPEGFTYAHERYMLRVFIRALAKASQDLPKYTGKNTEEDVVFMCEQSAITGNIFPIARMVEEVFGKGAFRRLGNVKNASEIMSVLEKKIKKS